MPRKSNNTSWNYDEDGVMEVSKGRKTIFPNALDSIINVVVETTEKITRPFKDTKKRIEGKPDSKGRTYFYGEYD